MVTKIVDETVEESGDVGDRLISLEVVPDRAKDEYVMDEL
jgi:hypothetical protein